MASLKFIFAVLSAAGNSGFNHGMHSALLNTIGTQVMQWYWTIRIQRRLPMDNYFHQFVFPMFILACFSAGAVTGSLLICVCAQFVGRKYTLIGSNILIIFTLTLQGLAYITASYEVLIIGRFFCGFSAGFVSGIAPMYLVEISPFCIRGTCGSFYYVMVALGTATAYILGMEDALGAPTKWSWIYFFCFFPACIQVASMLFCPETARHLLIDKEDDDEAEESLAWFRPDENIDYEMEELREEAAALKEAEPVTCTGFFTNQILRSPLIITTVILVGQRFSGVETILYFSSTIFSEMGYDLEKSRDLSIGLAFTSLIFAIVCMVIVDMVGRKILLLGSLGGILFASACLSLMVLLDGAIVGTVPEIQHIQTCFMYLLVASFSIGMGPIPWFYASELNNQPARPVAVTIGVTCNWLVHYLVFLSFWPLLFAVGNYIYMIYFIFDLMVIVFIFLTMRETMGLESIEIMDMFYD